MKKIRPRLPPLKKRPPSPRNLYRGRKYIPSLIIVCEGIVDAYRLLEEKGFVVGKTTPNFYQTVDGSTAVIMTEGEKVELYIRGNQENQI